MERYVPTAVDVMWARNVVSLVRDGGSWLYPDTGDEYVVDKKARTLTLVKGEGAIRDRLNIVFGFIGYGMIYGEREKSAERSVN